MYLTLVDILLSYVKARKLEGKQFPFNII